LVFHRSGALLLKVALVVASLSLPAHGEQPPASWSQWRGAGRDGLVAGAVWPDGLAPARLEKLWRVELGPGYSGPVIAGETVFVTETRDKKTEHVRALDRQTGRELWQASWEGSLSVPFFAASNGSWIRATPAVADGRIYVAGMRDILVCLDAATGAEIWRIDFTTAFESPLPAFGFVSSPLLLGDSV
jgi:outer membrane protein assembly factor BamB